MTIRTPNAPGFTLVEIMIVVAIVGLLATIATPTWVRARTRTQTHTCINNLKQIDGAKQQWALENKAAPDITPSFSSISSYLKSSVVCPSANVNATFDTSYNMNDVGTAPTCRAVPAEHVLPEITN